MQALDLNSSKVHNCEARLINWQIGEKRLSQRARPDDADYGRGNPTKGAREGETKVKSRVEEDRNPREWIITTYLLSPAPIA